MKMEMEIGMDEESRNKMSVESLNQSVAERRRRIVERSSDRLDLITGQMRSLSASSSLRLSPHHSDEAADPRSDETPLSTLPKHGTSSPDYSTEGHVVEKDKATLQNPTVEDMTNNQPILVTSLSQEASIDAKPPGGSCQSCWSKLFTHKHINLCILATGNTRACCALIIAVVVVLSYIDDPLFGKDILSSESVITSKPLYIVLLTNITIVLARLLLVKQIIPEQPPQQERDEGQENGDILMDAVHLLESGLVIYRIIRAGFIDCSICLVVVVCGVSLV